MYFFAFAIALKMEPKVSSPLFSISMVLLRESRALLLFRSRVHQGFDGFHIFFFQQFGLFDTLFLVFAHVLQPLEVTQSFHGEHFDLPVIHPEIDVEEQADTGE